MQSLTPTLADRLVDACPRYAYFDQIAISCDCTWSLVKSWLIRGVTSGVEPYRGFAQRFYAADTALGQRVHQMLTTGSLELELKDFPIDAVPADLAERIDSYWGPVLGEILSKTKSVVFEEGQDRPRAVLKLKGPDRKALQAWYDKRWPASEHVSSILPLTESKETKRKAMVESLADAMRGVGSRELAAALAEAEKLVEANGKVGDS